MTLQLRNRLEMKGSKTGEKALKSPDTLIPRPLCYNLFADRNYLNSLAANLRNFAIIGFFGVETPYVTAMPSVANQFYASCLRALYERTERERF